MLPLKGRSIEHSIAHEGIEVFAVTRNKNLQNSLRDKRALISEIPPEDSFPLWISESQSLPQSNSIQSQLLMPSGLEYLDEGDIISISDQGRVRVLFRTSAKYNTFLLTERCNHYCLMCSQPPKNVQDDWLLTQARDAIKLIPKSTPRIGFSGGEPTIYGEELINLIDLSRAYLPNTMVDILSNGRAFANEDYALSLGRIRHQSCMVCVPIYSHVPEIHDFVVQSDGAFDETIEGIINLKATHTKVEIRIVLHKQTINTLIDTCSYIVSNMRFVDHVALMGLEITGFTRANLDELWVDPFDYRDILSSAAKVLRSAKMNYSIYNHQLCTLNSDVYEDSVRSISDWKNEYLPECNNCSLRSDCGGFFSSGILYKHSEHIKPFT